MGQESGSAPGLQVSRHLLISAHLNWSFEAGVTLWYRAISRD